MKNTLATYPTTPVTTGLLSSHLLWLGALLLFTFPTYAQTSVQNNGITTAGNINFGSTTGDKELYFSNLYGRGIESSTLTDWSAVNIRWRIGGTSASTGNQQMLLNTTGLNVSGSLSVNADDSVALPGFTWNGDTNTGIYWAGADQIGLTTGGAQRALVNSTGVTVTGAVAATTVGGSWIATQAEAEAGTLNTKVMTPLRVKQSIAANATGGASNLYSRCTNASTSTVCAGAKSTPDIYRPISCNTTQNTPTTGNGIAGYFSFSAGTWQVYVNAWYTCTDGTLIVMNTNNI